jgi:hypothetical protein
MLTLAIEPTAIPAVIIVSTWLTILLSVMTLLVLVLVPHEAWTSVCDTIRSGIRGLLGHLSSTRSKDDDQP